MLNRSVFEGMAVAQWACANPRRAVELFAKHERHSEILWAQSSARTPDDQVLDTGSETERAELGRLFGRFGHKLWTGHASLRDLPHDTEQVWPDAQRAEVWWYLRVIYNDSNQVLHSTSTALGGAASFAAVNAKVVLTAVPTRQYLERGVLGAFWWFYKTPHCPAARAAHATRSPSPASRTTTRPACRRACGRCRAPWPASRCPLVGRAHRAGGGSPPTLRRMLAGYDHLLRAAERLRWDERRLDLAEDARAYRELDPARARGLRRLVAGFCVAEAAVAEHLVPFEAAAADGALQACLAAQADDERRHARFFARVAREVVGLDPVTDAPRVAGDALNRLFGRLLPEAAEAVAADPDALPDAVALYHLILEGVVFSAGQDLLVWLLTDIGTLPVTLDGVRRVQGDERWHIGLGVQCLSLSGVAPPPLDEALELALDAWGEAADRDEALARHRRRMELLTGRATAPRSPS